MLLFGGQPRLGLQEEELAAVETDAAGAEAHHVGDLSASTFAISSIGAVRATGAAAFSPPPLPGQASGR